MHTSQHLPVAIVTIIAAAISMGCGDDEQSRTTATAPVSKATPTASPQPTTVAPATDPPTSAMPPPAGGELLFSDELADDTNRWGVVDDAQFGTATFEGGDYVWDFRGSIAHWLPGVLIEQYDAGELDMLNVQVSAELSIVSGGGVAGVFCRENPDSDAEWQWYEFVVRDGYAAIRQSDLEGNITALVESNDVELPLGAPITIDGTCRNDDTGAVQLSMVVNGNSLLEATVSENPLTNGAPGMSAWTFPLHEPMDIVWHSFSVRSVT